MLAFALHILTAPIQQSDIQLGTLSTLLTPLAKEAGYNISIPDPLAGRPVVYGFWAPLQPPKERISDIAQRLDLVVISSEEAKLITIGRSNQIKASPFRTRIIDSINKLKQTLQPYAEKSSAELYSESMRLMSLSLKNPYPEEAAQQSRLSENLRQLSQPLGRLALLPFLERPSGDLAGLLSRPISQQNFVTLSGQGQQIGQALLSRRFSTPDQFLEKADFTDEEWENISMYSSILRGQISDVPENAEIVYAHHGARIFVQAITPERDYILSAAGMDISPPVEQAVPDQAEMTQWTARVKTSLPFTREMIGSSLNALGRAAQPMKKNYVGWLYDQVPQLGKEETSLRDYAAGPMARVLKLRASESGDWLVLRDYNNLWPEYAADWRTFERLRPLMEKDSYLSEWRVALNSLSPQDLAELELTLTDASSLFGSDYRAMTQAACLLRAALNEMAADGVDSFSKPIRQLAPEARNDANRFFGSHYVWAYNRWLTHSVNMRKRDNVLLFAKVVERDGQKRLTFGLEFPAVHFTFTRPADSQFSIPIKTE